MAYLKYLILALLLVCNVSFAGYAQLKPPPGWSQGMGAAVPGQAGVFAFGVAANASSFKGSTVLTNAALNVAGQLVTIPVSMRVAANAATVAAEWSFGNPYLFAAALAAPYAYNWFKENGLEVKDGIWKWKDPATCMTGCLEYQVASAGWFPSKSGACAAWVSAYTAGFYTGPGGAVYTPNVDGNTCQIMRRPVYADGTYGQPIVSGSNPIGSRTRPPDPEVWTPATPEKFKEIMAPKPLPNGVPQELPGVPWPVQKPVINPDPAIDPLPEPSPAAVPRPLWIPLGDPVKQPSVEGQPDTWIQPGVRVNPSPTESDPWRVDVQPEDKVKNDPSPNVDEGTPDTTTTPTPEPTKPLCELYPDILACQKLDTPDSDNLETKDKNISISPDSGWDSGSGSCPVPRHFSKGDFSFQIYCDFASGIKPVIIAVAWLVAAGILIGFKFGES